MKCTYFYNALVTARDHQREDLAQDFVKLFRAADEVVPHKNVLQ